MTTDEKAGNTEAACVHHWEIGNPNGRTSAGVCRECGAEREFSTNGVEPARSLWSVSRGIVDPWSEI